jgi:hypothetical protein
MPPRAPDRHGRPYFSLDHNLLVSLNRLHALAVTPWEKAVVQWAREQTPYRTILGNDGTYDYDRHMPAVLISTRLEDQLVALNGLAREAKTDFQKAEVETCAAMFHLDLKRDPEGLYHLPDGFPKHVPFDISGLGHVPPSPAPPGAIGLQAAPIAGWGTPPAFAGHMPALDADGFVKRPYEGVLALTRKEPLPPGETVFLKTQTVDTIRILRTLIPDELCRHLMVDDIRVGGSSVLSNGDSIGGLFFASSVGGFEHTWPGAAVGTEIKVSMHNAGKEPIPYMAIVCKGEKLR